MAEPFDSARTWMTDVASAVRVAYDDSYDSLMPRQNRVANKIFGKVKKRDFNGNQLVIQQKIANFDGARFTNDPVADFRKGESFQSSSFTVTWDAETPSNNDFRRLDCSLQTTWYDIKRGMDKQVTAVDFAAELVADSVKDVAEKLAIGRYLNKAGSLGTIGVTPKKNDNRLYASCAALTTTGGARFTLSSGTGSIAYFSPNVKINSYTGDTLDYTLRVTDFNARDGSVGVYGTNATTGDADSTANIGSIAAADKLYYSGQKDKNIKSIGEWFATPATGDSHFGKDRTSMSNAWFLPHLSGPSSNQTFTKTYLDDFADEIGYVTAEDGNVYVAVAQPELITKAIQEIGQDLLIQQPGRGGEMLAQYGFDNLVYRHHSLGVVKFEADRLHPTNSIGFYRLGDWESISYLNQGFQWVPGGDLGDWYRMESSTPGNGKTLIFKMDGFTNVVDICRNIRRNGRIVNVTA